MSDTAVKKPKGKMLRNVVILTLVSGAMLAVGYGFATRWTFKMSEPAPEKDNNTTTKNPPVLSADTLTK